MRFSAEELAVELDGRLLGPDTELSGLAIDSRTLVPGQLFAAVRGERDGHDFVASALEAGAAALLLRADAALPDVGDGSVTSIVVDDVEQALGKLAKLARGRLPDRVVGVTGSVGKTTTKDLLASVLGQKFVTAASERSFNNELGVPLTLMNAPDDTEATVVEMGARGEGHIALLCALASPTVGVVTTVDSVHTEVMGTLEQIAVVKGELIEALPTDGLAVLNADVPLVAAMSARTQARVLTFGVSGDVRARNISIDDELLPSFVLVSPWGEVVVRLGARGEHNVSNALAAATVALALDVPLEDVASGLESPTQSPWRMELSRLSSGAAVLNDSYNASPTSMAAAMRSVARLADRDAGGRCLAVVGLMAELGEGSATEHRDIAHLATDLGIELISVGTDLYGVEPVADVEAAASAVERWGPTTGDAVLVKGSRVAGLERLSQTLLNNSAP